MEIISSDSHVVEPPTLWEEYVVAAHQDRIPRIVAGEEGDLLICDDVELAPIGLLAGCLRSDDEIRTAGTWEDDIPPAAYEPKIRRGEVEADGVSGEVLFPTVAMNIYRHEDAELRAALFEGYNRWLADFCAEAPEFYKGLAVLDVTDVARAVAELRKSRDLGLSGAMIPLFTEDDNPYHLERFEPLWAAAAELGMPINMHSATTRNKKAFWKEGTITERMLRAPGQIQKVILDLTFAGVFDRHPDLMVISAENDIGWAGHMLERADYWWRRNRSLTGDVNEMACEHPPSGYFGKNVAGTFMRDYTAVYAHRVIGEDAIMFGTDFPHHVSTWPQTTTVVAEHFASVPEEVAAHIAWKNVDRIYDFGRS